MSLGRREDYDDLVEARERAAELRKQLRRGIAPIETKRAGKVKAKPIVSTFEQVAEDCIAALLPVRALIAAATARIWADNATMAVRSGSGPPSSNARIDASADNITAMEARAQPATFISSFRNLCLYVDSRLY